MPTPESKLPVSTSKPPEFPEAQEELFREVLEVLNGCQISYAVSGAFALHYHTGIWRNTKDLDLFLTAEELPKAMACLERNGLGCEVCDPVWLAKAKRNDYFVDLITGMSNAVIVVDDSWIKNSKASDVLGIPTRVLPAEELLASKLFVMRRERYDFADIAHVIFGTKGALDWNRILKLVHEHWEVLLGTLVLFRYVYPANSHYVPASVWQHLLTRFQAELASPNPTAKFRGSLIDDNMFAIDVEEWGMDDMLGRHRANREAGIAAKEGVNPHPVD